MTLKTSSGILLSLILSGTLISCSSKPANYQALSNSADPNAEIESLRRDLQTAKDQQIDTVSPDNYARAEKASDNAQQARAKNKSNEKVLEQVALGKAYLKAAQDKAQVSTAAMGNVLRARQSAMNANARNMAPKEFNRAEKEFGKLTERAEQGDLMKVEKTRDDIASLYRDAEIVAMKSTLLGGAERTYQKAQDEGAKKYSPKTYTEVRKEIDSVAGQIDKNPAVDDSVRQAATKSQADAEHLLATTRSAKMVKGQTPEETALRIQQEEAASAASLAAQSATSQQNLAAKDQTLTEQERALREKEQALNQSNQQVAALGQKLGPQQAYEEVRKNFSPSEADVMLQGNKVLVRLKALNFPSNRAEIQSTQFPLLKKLGDSISQVSASKVTVEGHTDAVGSASKNKDLSDRRAKAVGDYLTANNVESDKVETVGYGYSKPITENKTKAGRAQNRRIDVMIEL